MNTSIRRGWLKLVPMAGAGLVGVLFGATAFLRYDRPTASAPIALVD